jgi:hypothetical protein
MLKIKQPKKYNIPIYPAGAYYENTGKNIDNFIKKAAASTALITALEGCDCLGTTGPPPVMPTMVTENEAKPIIDSVFASQGYNLDSNILIDVPSSDLKITIDGYDSAQHVGYEYLWETNFDENRDSVQHSFSKQTEEKILFMEPVEKIGVYKDSIIKEVNDFIELIKANGFI